MENRVDDGGLGDAYIQRDHLESGREPDETALFFAMTLERLGTKQRVKTHMMETESGRLLASLLRPEWILRDYKPDYGLDLAVEVFSPPNSQGASETLGEHFFIQLKSADVVKRLARRTMSPHDERASVDGAEQIACVVHSLETSELRTIEVMGSAVVVLLVLVELSTKDAWFVCLNDYVDKVLARETPRWQTQGHNSIYIPLANRLSVNGEAALQAIGFYSKRPKLLAAFQQFNLLNHEVQQLLRATQSISDDPEDTSDASVEELCSAVQAHTRRILRWDLWGEPSIWWAINDAAHQLRYTLGLLERWGPPFATDAIPRDLVSAPESGWRMHGDRDIESLEPAELRWVVLTRIGTLWSQLANLPRMYEELCRGWFLPTEFGYLFSPPKVLAPAANEPP